MRNNPYLPKSILKGKIDSRGRITINEWDINSIMSLAGTAEFFGSFLFAALTICISPFLTLVLSLLTLSGRPNVFTFVGLILGSYFLIDASHCWLITTFLFIFFSENSIEFFVKLTIASVIMHLVLLFISLPFIYKDLIKSRPLMLITLLLIFLGFFLSYKLYATNVVKKHGQYERVYEENFGLTSNLEDTI